MSSDERVFQWIKSKMRNCPGSDAFTIDHFKLMYTSPAKDVIDLMTGYLRNEQDVKKIKAYVMKRKVDEMRRRKEETMMAILKLEAENSLLREKRNKSGNRVGISKASVLKQCTDFTQLQGQLVQKVCKTADALSSSFVRQQAPPQSFSFNAASGKLESMAKSETRKVMGEEMSSGGQKVLALICKYDGQERQSILNELVQESRNEAWQLADGVDLERDSTMLRFELEGEKEEDILFPLERHLRDMTLKHATCALLVRDQLSRAALLKKMFNKLVPEAAREEASLERFAVQSSHLAKAHVSVRERKQQTPVAELNNFALEVESRKDKIVALLDNMEKMIGESGAMLVESADTSASLSPALTLRSVLQHHLEQIAAATLMRGPKLRYAIHDSMIYTELIHRADFEAAQFCSEQQIKGSGPVFAKKPELQLSHNSITYLQMRLQKWMCYERVEAALITLEDTVAGKSLQEWADFFETSLSTANSDLNEWLSFLGL